MKLKSFDVELFPIPDREFGAVRITRNGQTPGPIREHDYQFIIIQLLTEQAKMRSLLEAVHHAYTDATDNEIMGTYRAVQDYINSLSR